MNLLIHRDQIESLVMIRRLNHPSRTSSETLIAHAIRFRFQKRLRDIVNDQRIGDQDKVKRIKMMSQLLGEATKEAKSIAKNRHRYQRWFQNIVRVILFLKTYFFSQELFTKISK